jgi:predicted permease
MKTLRATMVRLAGLFRRRQREAEMNDELRAHFDGLIDRNIAAGMSPGEARFAAMRAFGGMEQVKERARDERRSLRAEQIWQDVRHALRTLGKTRTFTLVAIASLAVAIGANTAIFALIETMVLRPLPVRNPHELFLLGWQPTGTKGGPTKGDGGDIDRGEKDLATGQPIRRIFSLPAFEQFRGASAPIAEVFATTQLWQPQVEADGVAERLACGHLVSGNYHDVLGVSAAIGRALRPEDDMAGAPPVIVISHRYWQRRFASHAAVVGKTVWLNRSPVTIVGVTPPGFVGVVLGGGPADVTAPVALAPLVCPEADEMPMRDPGFWWLRVMGRLKPGATRDAMRASLEGVFLSSAREGWNNPAALPRLIASPASHGRSEQNQRDVVLGMMPFAGMGALLLLVACANLANLLLARGAALRREFAVRLALGAGRGRLVRQLLTEGLLLAFAGCAVGILLAAWGLDLVTTLIPPADAPDLFHLQLDWRIAGFTSALAGLTALLSALAPALRATRIDLTVEFQGGPRTCGGGPAAKLSRSLMVAQVAFSLVLLAMAGLLARTVHNLRSVDIGFDPRRLLLFSLEGVPAGYAEGPRLEAMYRDAATRLRAIPGAQAVTFSRTPVLSRHGTNRTTIQSIGGATLASERPEVGWDQVETRFFATYEMPLLLGRTFTERDNATAPKVAIINQSLAKKYFADENPIGRSMRLGRRGLGEVEIVGVVRDFRQQNLRRETLPAVYTAAAQSPVREAHFAVRTAGQPELFAAAVSRAVAEVDPHVPVANLRTQAEQIEWTMAEEKIFGYLAEFFGFAALALACIGLYGLMSYAVVRRTGEIGVRIALGAVPGQVLGMILRESFRLVAIGVLLGVGGALAAGSLLANLLYGVPPNDAVTIGGAALILIGVALGAALLPARRAARIDPMVALRAE